MPGKSVEQLFGPTLHAPLLTRTTEGDAATAQWAGFTTLNSGSTFVTVSTPMIQSGALVFTGLKALGSLAAAHGSGGMVVVDSIVEDISFALARATGTAVPWNDVVMWMIVRTTET